MNLLHMKYAIAVAEVNSINKAAESLLVGAPALSRAIKELENSLGVSLFERSAKGMELTPDGEVFVQYARKALKQVDDIENLFKEGSLAKKQFSVSGPRATYISDAFARFSTRVDPTGDTELFYRETNASRIIKNVTGEDCRLGILRYNKQFTGYYESMMAEKDLVHEVITDFRYEVIMSKNSPLSRLENITYNDLMNYTEIAHADPYVPSLSFAEVKKAELPETGRSRIYVYERASQFELLSRNLNTYMWVSPLPESTLEWMGLVQKRVEQNQRVYQDVLVYKKDYRLSELDEMFIEELMASKRRVFGE